MVWRVGVDTGGAFTDVCLCNESDGSAVVGKISSAPRDPGQAVIDGVTKFLGEYGPSLFEVGYFAPGATVATNALLQTRVLKTRGATTHGFRDLLELGRQRRPKLYDLTARKADPLATRDLRFEVSERVNCLGEVEGPLSEAEVRLAAAILRDADVKSVAVCLLYSYLNSGHEEILEDELSGVFTTTSSEVLPEFREYERLAMVVINAFIGPVMQGYLSRMRLRLKEAGLPVEVNATQSNRDVTPFEAVETQPGRTVLSSPITGVVGAVRLAVRVISVQRGYNPVDSVVAGPGLPSGILPPGEFSRDHPPL
ncbi:hydantoinase/oxoprolinase N-terminal domain-containing protein [Streptomyces chartreusis]|uniref:hydantoinase/oxoprolinase N-terminal domain-containing protein n=1 Tax=Streptomyces chartreusis TaxID=1969 RepID=UPI0033CB5A3F